MKAKKLIYVILTLLFISILFIGISMFFPSNSSSNSVYASTLNSINDNMNRLMSEIEKEMRADPKIAMLGSPIDFIRNSSSYKNIINLGLNVVKPLYDKLYESHDAGLYEYILALAIEEITQEEFIYNANYGWKNSLEFRLCYETKVNNSETNVEKIINNENLSNEEKIAKFKEQGIFAVPFLIDEYNNINSKVSKEVIEIAIKDIAIKYNIFNNNEKSSDFINKNKDLFNSLVDLNGKAYK